MTWDSQVYALPARRALAESGYGICAVPAKRQLAGFVIAARNRGFLISLSRSGIRVRIVIKSNELPQPRHKMALVLCLFVWRQECSPPSLPAWEQVLSKGGRQWIHPLRAHRDHERASTSEVETHPCTCSNASRISSQSQKLQKRCQLHIGRRSCLSEKRSHCLSQLFEGDLAPARLCDRVDSRSFRLQQLLFDLGFLGTDCM